MINLKDYCEGMQPKDTTDFVFFDEIRKKKETCYIIFLPKSIVDELKKGVIAEWE